MAEPAALSPDDAAFRRAAWDTALPDLNRWVLAQWCDPLKGVRGSANKATVLGILSAALHEQQQHWPGYAAFMAVDPLTIRDAALRLPDETAAALYKKTAV